MAAPAKAEFPWTLTLKPRKKSTPSAYAASPKRNPLTGHSLYDVAVLVAGGTVSPTCFVAWIRQRDATRQQRAKRKAPRKRGAEGRVSRNWPVPAGA